MSKGTRNERKYRECLESAGWWTYSPENASYSDNDLWNLFDVSAINIFTGEIRFTQVKTNGTQGSLGSYADRAKHFIHSCRQTAVVSVEFCIRYDQYGWRVYDVGVLGHTSLRIDTRDWSVPIDQGLSEYYQLETVVGWDE